MVTLVKVVSVSGSLPLLLVAAGILLSIVVLLAGDLRPPKKTRTAAASDAKGSPSSHPVGASAWTTAAEAAEEPERH